MDPGTWLLIIALSILVASYIARPLVEKKGLGSSSEEKLLSLLQEEKEQALSMLQELEMDFAMGKVKAEDYQAERSELIRRGASILRQVDQLSGSDVAGLHGLSGHEEGGPEALEAEIERAISRRRKKQRVTAAGFCTQCGNQVLPGDRFCVRCGARVGTSEAET
jgi:hypothetical protein